MRSLALLGLFAHVVALAFPVSAQPPAGSPPAQNQDTEPSEEPEGPVGGEIQSEGARTEILPEPPPVGRTVNTPEGWYRVEAAPDRDTRATGSLSIVSRSLFAPPEPTPAPRPQGPAAAKPAPETEEEATPAIEITVEEAVDPCRGEKDRYLARLLEYLEIDDIDHPLSLLEGIEELPAGTGLGPFVRLSLFGLPAGGPVSVDPVRPLAWDSELRSIARDLATCVRDRGER